MHLEASCDGLLIIYFPGNSSKDYDICNLATRQHAPLPLLSNFSVAGMYPHAPTGDYRLLLYTPQKLIYKHYLAPDAQYACHVFTLGSSEPPRLIGWPEPAEAIYDLLPGVLVRGRLHWHLGKKSESSSDVIIMVFDTMAESFRKMRAPGVPGGADLFEMDGVLGMSSFNNREAEVVKVWAMEDYGSEVWALKYRVELPVPEVSTQTHTFKSIQKVVATPCGDEVLLLVKCGGGLLQVYNGTKLVASFHDTCVHPIQLRLKQTLVRHTFFPKLDGYAVNASPFI
jgi:F-box interacting protein